MGLMGYLNTLLSALTGDVSISSAANLDHLQYVSSTGKWTNRQLLGTETNLATTVAGANDTVLNTTNRYYTIFTVPSTAPYFQITAMECLNGTVAAGNGLMGVEEIVENPPSTATTNLLAVTRRFAQTGTGTVQRIDNVSMGLVKAGALCGAFIVSDSATGRYGTTTVAAANRLRGIALASAVFNANTAWASGTEEPYIKVYAKPFFGV